MKIVLIKLKYIKKKIQIGYIEVYNNKKQGIKVITIFMSNMSLKIQTPLWF